jgi:hypothetical protein
LAIEIHPTHARDLMVHESAVLLGFSDASFYLLNRRS